MTKLYILCGFPFSGKSTLAKAMAKMLDLEIIDLDEIKFELFGKDIPDENLTQDDWDKIYPVMYKRIEKTLLSGKSVVHDTGNFTKAERDSVRKIADKIGQVETITIFVDIPYEVAKKRLVENRITKQRFGVTDKNFEDAVAEMEIPGRDENTFTYDAKVPQEQWVKETFK